jgi:flagellar biosynthetic protein FlhB
MSERGQKTEAPTPKRRRESRRKGEVARSMEISMWAQVLVAVNLCALTFRLLQSSLRDTMARTGQLIEQPDQRAAIRLLGTASFGALVAIGPLCGGMALVAVVTNIGQTGFLLSAHRLKPSFDRVNPFKGLKRMLSKDSAVDAAKQLARLGAMGGVSITPMSDLANRIVDQRPTFAVLTAMVGSTTLALARRIALAGIGFGAVDYAIQKRRLMKRLRMSKQEVKEEHRSTEGDPHVRSHRRSVQMAMSRNRMMADVATATAVVINPTHIAVAITYRRAGGAPRVVAKGKGDIARRIREEAERHGVPIVRNIPLARTLHGSCRVGQEIPADMYEAVARLLAFVMSVGRRSSWAGPLTMA